MPILSPHRAGMVVATLVEYAFSEARAMDPHLTPDAPGSLVGTKTARDIMSAGVTTVAEDLDLAEAVALMATKGLRGLAVVNSAGLPVGVLTSGDVVVHHHEASQSRPPPDSPATRVGHVMTPAVFAVAPETTVVEVIREVLRLKVNRVYVVEQDRLIGVISALDLLRQLPLEGPAATR
jgi:CBS domain-containing protein